MTIIIALMSYFSFYQIKDAGDLNYPAIYNLFIELVAIGLMAFSLITIS